MTILDPKPKSWEKPKTLEDWPWDMELGKPHGVVGDNGIREPESRFTDYVPEPKDKINPEHYKQLPIECITITENFNFNLGNVLKYVMRCDHKGAPLDDLRKAAWYLKREIARRRGSD